jgi:hypothetical protein
LAAIRLSGSREGDAGASSAPSDLNTIDRTVAIVEAASAKIGANDFSAVETLFMGQALALDAMFENHARQTTLDDIRFALRSQRQCVATFKTLMQMKNPQLEKFPRKRTEEATKASG